MAKVLVENTLQGLFPEVDEWKTQVWLSEGAHSALIKFGKKKDNPAGRFLKLLKKYAETGFEHWKGSNQPIRLEWDGVFRIGSGYTTFRLFGFFAGNEGKEFVILDGFVTKKLRKNKPLTREERARIQKNVVDVKKSGNWERAPQGE